MDKCPDLIDSTFVNVDEIDIQMNQTEVKINLLKLVPDNIIDEGRKIGVTIVTGFLGSGKTTLIEYLTKENHGYKIAIVLNDFGDSSSIEKAAISIGDSKPSYEAWMELSNGCMCCSVKDFGVKAVENLINSNKKIEHVIVETSGMADPVNLIKTWWLDDAIQTNVYLNGVVTLVDAKNFLNNYQDSERQKLSKRLYPDFIFRQIALADILIVNKIDLVSNELINSILSNLKTLNPTNKIITTIRSKVDLRYIFNINAYDRDDLINTIEMRNINVNEAQNQFSLNTYCINLKSELKDKNLFEKWIQTILWEKNIPSNLLIEIDVLRLKAIVKIAGCDHYCVIQGVEDLYDFISIPISAELETKFGYGKIIFIGCNINFKELEASFREIN